MNLAAQKPKRHARALVMATAPAKPPFGFIPAALLPFGSRPMIDHVIGALALQGWKTIVVEAGSFRPELNSLLEGGAPWNIEIDVRGRVDRDERESFALRLQAHRLGKGLLEGNAMRGVPSLHSESLRAFLRSNLSLLEGRCPFVDEPAIEGRDGVRRATRRTRISPRAKLIAPLIIGEDVVIRPGAEVGPYAVCTSGVIIGRGARLSHSLLAGGMALRRGGSCRGMAAVAGQVIPTTEFGSTRPGEDGLLRLPSPPTLFGVAIHRSSITPHRRRVQAP